MPARSRGLYLCDRKIRKNSNPFPMWKIWFGLYWFGAADGTGFSRLVAARSAPFSSPTGAWFIAASSSPIRVDDFRQTKKLSILSKALCWCGRWNWIRTRSACFCNLFFDEFYTLVIGRIASISANLYYERVQQTGICLVLYINGVSFSHQSYRLSFVRIISFDYSSMIWILLFFIKHRCTRGTNKIK